MRDQPLGQGRGAACAGDRMLVPRAAGQRAQAVGYQGEVLNFESVGALFGRLSERRRALVQALRGQGVLAQRELAGRLGRNVKRVLEDVQVLVELDLLERADGGRVPCPFAAVHISMEMCAAA